MRGNVLVKVPPYFILFLLLVLTDGSAFSLPLSHVSDH